MSEIQVGDMVRIVRYIDNPNPVYDQKHFAIGSVHIVKAVVDDPLCGPSVGLMDKDHDEYLLRLDEVEKV